MHQSFYYMYLYVAGKNTTRFMLNRNFLLQQYKCTRLEEFSRIYRFMIESRKCKCSSQLRGSLVRAHASNSIPSALGSRAALNLDLISTQQVSRQPVVSKLASLHQIIQIQATAKFFLHCLEFQFRSKTRTPNLNHYSVDRLVTPFSQQKHSKYGSYFVLLLITNCNKQTRHQWLV